MTSIEAVIASVNELMARQEARALLHEMGVEAGPDPVQQVIDLARDVAQLVGPERKS